MSRKKFSDNLNKLKEKVLEHEESRPIDHERFGTEHMLIALSEQPNSPAAKLLAAEGFSQESAGKELAALKEKSNSVRPSQAPHSSGTSTSDMLREANNLASRFDSGCVDVEHVLLAIVQRPKTGAYQLLTKLGISHQKLETALVKRLQEQTSAQ